MKKKCCTTIRWHGWEKLFLMARITLFFFLIGLLHVSASVYSQKTNLALKMEKNTIEQVLKEIEDQSDFYFLYRTDLLLGLPTVSIQVKDAKIEEILDKILIPNGLDYKIEDQVVVIKKASEKVTPVPVEQKGLSGKVKDKSGLPIPGVSVVVKGTTVGTITNEEGKFLLNVPADAKIIVFSFVGMISQEVEIAGKTVFDVVLAEETIGVEEVVIVGYGQQTKVSVTGAISSVDTKEMLKSPASSVQNTLAGRAPGIISVQRSGGPGDDFANIYIRGQATTGNSTPLILVDGIERDITTLDPNEIESFNVLKDASATAVFGVRGANGVIVITTKTGSAGSKPTISFTANYGFSSPERIPRYLTASEFVRIQNQASRNDNISNAAWVAPFSDQEIALYDSGVDPIFHANTDWMDILMKDNAPQQNYNMNISGGTEKAKYFVSLGYFGQTGMMGGLQVFDDIPVNGHLDRYNIRANTDFQWTKNFSTAVKFSTQIAKGINTDISVADGSNVLHGVFSMNPISSIPLYDGKIIDKVPETEKYVSSSNPMTLWSNNYTIEYEARTTLDLSTVYKLDAITKGLSVRGKFAYDNYYRQNATRTRAIDKYEIRRIAPGYEGDYFTLVQTSFAGAFTGSESYSSNYRLYSEASLNYGNTFSGGHTVNGLILGTMERSYRGGTPALPFNYMGLVGRTTYDYKKKYLVEFNMGYNGSENFAKGKQFGFFPSYSLGYVISEEEFFPKNDIITFLKIRGSQGKVGNDKIGNSRFLYTPSSYSFSSPAATSINNIRFGDANTIVPGMYREAKIGNPDISWEIATKSNIGLEMKLVSDAISFSGDLFKERREGILGTYNNVPYTFGDVSKLPSYNLGIVDNWGYEFEAGYRSSNKKEFQYRISGNFTFARNKIVYNDEIPPKYPNLVRTGLRIGQPFMLLSDGFYNTWDEVNDPARVKTTWDLNVQPGDVRFQDVTGDNFVDFNDQTAVGYSGIPEIVYGITTGFNWKNFDLTILFQGAEHVSNYYGTPMYPNILWAARVENVFDAWTQEKYEAGDKILSPRLSMGNSGANAQTNSYMNIDASYFRIKNLEFGYNFNKTFTRKFACEMLRVYFSGQNLATFSEMKYWDPESARNTDRQYPVTRVLNFGVRANF
jgi:TonB-linked SusC/RagA family outer membrane protein